MSEGSRALEILCFLQFFNASRYHFWVFPAIFYIDSVNDPKDWIESQCCSGDECVPVVLQHVNADSDLD